MEITISFDTMPWERKPDKPKRRERRRRREVLLVTHEYSNFLHHFLSNPFAYMWTHLTLSTVFCSFSTKKIKIKKDEVELSQDEAFFLCVLWTTFEKEMEKYDILLVKRVSMSVQCMYPCLIFIFLKGWQKRTEWESTAGTWFVAAENNFHQRHVFNCARKK